MLLQLLHHVAFCVLTVDAKVKKLADDLKTTKEQLKEVLGKAATKAKELHDAQAQLASALSRIEISNAAAVGEVQKLMAEKINEAYKEGQRDAQRFLKEMRSFFP